MTVDSSRGSRAGQRLRTDLAPGEFRRLGKPGAYRLGQLRAQGISVRRPPTAFRARFSRRREHRWTAQAWLFGMLGGVALIAVGTAVGWDFVPLLAGLGAGAANRAGRWPPRVALPAVAAMGVTGWIVPFLLPNVPGNSGGALARTAGALIGLPGDAAPVVALTALVAVVQALAGYWVASAIRSRLPDDQIR